MKLEFAFQCCITTNIIRKNYSGEITLSPKGADPKKFFFLILNPHEPHCAELMIWTDPERNELYLEASSVGKNEMTDAISYDFTGIDDSLQKASFCLILGIMINASVKMAELAWQDESVHDRAAQPLRCILDNIFNVELSEKNAVLGQAFLESFGLYNV